MHDFLDRAQRIADDVLFPDALAVGTSGAVPDSHFRLLAEEGFYGIVAPPEIGGAGLDLADVLAVIETFGGGCLATASIWLQHHGVLLALADTDNTALWAEYLGSMLTGRLRASIAVSGAVRRTLTAKRVPSGFVINGVVPGVLGWDSVDVLLLSASDPHDDAVVTGLVDRSALAGVAVARPELAVGMATDTASLTFTDFFLPDERVTREVLRAEFTAGEWFVSRINGSLSLGVAARCTRLLAEHDRPDLAEIFGFQVIRARGRLDTALDVPDTMPAARAEAAELAYRVAGVCVAALGSHALLAAQHAQRLVRDALYTLVAFAEQDVRAETVRLQGRSPVTAGAVFPQLPL